MGTPTDVPVPRKVKVRVAAISFLAAGRSYRPGASAAIVAAGLPVAESWPAERAGRGLLTQPMPSLSLSALEHLRSREAVPGVISAPARRTGNASTINLKSKEHHGYGHHNQRQTTALGGLL